MKDKRAWALFAGEGDHAFFWGFIAAFCVMLGFAPMIIDTAPAVHAFNEESPNACIPARN